MIKLKTLLAGMMMLFLGACATANVDGKVPLGSLGQRVAEAVVDVSDKNRDLRICWLAAGAVEVMTDMAQRGGEDTMQSLGHLMLLQAAIDKARMSDSFWIETDNADVALLFAAVLKDVGKSRLSQILLGGPTVTNFLNVARRTVVLTVKGHAVMRDINRVLQGVEDGVIKKVDAWRACENRTAINRNTLYMLSGVSSTSLIGGSDQLIAGVAALRITDEGWLDERSIDLAEYDIIHREYSGGGSGGIGLFASDGGSAGVSTETMVDWSLGTQIVELDLIYPDGWVDREDGLYSLKTMLSKDILYSWNKPERGDVDGTQSEVTDWEDGWVSSTKTFVGDPDSGDITFGIWPPGGRPIDYTEFVELDLISLAQERGGIDGDGVGLWIPIA